jgi:PKD repeat protein
MIDWATPVLGESHPSLAQVRSKYEGGEHYQSLLTVRGALKTLPERTHVIGFMDDGETHTARVTANTYVTDLWYDPDRNTLAFSTHGPPLGTVEMEADMLDDVGILRMVLDDVTQMESTESDAPAVYGFEFPQGPHEVTIELNFNQPPVAGFSYTPQEIVAGEEVQFSDESTDRGSLDYHWSFGDGYTSSQPSPAHTYSETGTHSVTLRVVDAYGLEDSVSLGLTVLRPPELVYSNLQIKPDAIRINGDMTVSIDCENVGDIRGTEELDLLIDGQVVMTETVTLEAGESDTVEFVYTPTVRGTHKIEVDGFTDEFRVEGIPGFPPVSILIGVTLVLILLTRRRAPRPPPIQQVFR